MQLADIADRLEDRRHAFGRAAGEFRRQRLDLEPVDGDHRMAVVQHVMRERESRGPEPHHQHLLARGGLGERIAQVEGIPARQQAVDLEAPGQLQDILEGAGLRLGNVDRLLLLIDAGLHAVVADAVARRRRHGIVHHDHGERPQRHALGLQAVHLGDLLLEGTAGQRHLEGALLEAAVALLQPAAAGILPLVMAEDAVVGLVEGAGQIGAGIGEGEALAVAVVMGIELGHGDAMAIDGLHRHQMIGIELARRLEQHAGAMLGPARLGERRPGGIAARRDRDRPCWPPRPPSSH